MIAALVLLGLSAGGIGLTVWGFLLNRKKKTSTPS